MREEVNLGTFLKENNNPRNLRSVFVAIERNPGAYYLNPARVSEDSELTVLCAQEDYSVVSERKKDSELSSRGRLMILPYNSPDRGYQVSKNPESIS